MPPTIGVAHVKWSPWQSTRGMKFWQRTDETKCIPAKLKSFDLQIFSALFINFLFFPQPVSVIVPESATDLQIHWFIKSLDISKNVDPSNQHDRTDCMQRFKTPALKWYVEIHIATFLFVEEMAKRTPLTCTFDFLLSYCVRWCGLTTALTSCCSVWINPMFSDWATNPISTSGNQRILFRSSQIFSFPNSKI